MRCRPRKRFLRRKAYAKSSNAANFLNERNRIDGSGKGQTGQQSVEAPLSITSQAQGFEKNIKANVKVGPLPQIPKTRLKSYDTNKVVKIAKRLPSSDSQPNEERPRRVRILLKVLEAHLQVQGSRIVEVCNGLCLQGREGRMYWEDSKGVPHGPLRYREVSRV